MYLLMIVDDDPLLCHAMCVKIELVSQESGLAFPPTLVAHSVGEALQLLEENPVDILITDIQMPYQSGLTLIEAVGSRYPHIQLVVLSGYSDYEYMRGAMHGGVTDYLLKPVKLSQLQEVLLKCVDKLEQQKATEKTESQRLEQRFQLELDHALNALLSGSQEAYPVLDSLPGPLFTAALCAGSPPGQLAAFFQEYSGAQSTHSTPEKPGLFCYPVTDLWHNALLVISHSQENQQEIVSYLQGLSDFCHSRGLALRWGVSPPATTLRSYPALHQEARRALSYQLLESFTVKLASQTAPASSKGGEPLSACCARLRVAFQSRNFHQLSVMIPACFSPSFFSYPGATPQDVKALYHYYLAQAKEVAAELHLEPEESPRFASFTSFEEMQQYCKELLYLIGEQSEKSVNKNRHIIHIATRYIEENYNREISMNEAANAVSMSYSYFSKFFKEQTGQSFSEYLTGVRMREAKRLLEEDPSIKSKDVAALVGYESVYSFSRAYKQYYNIPPKQMR